MKIATHLVIYDSLVEFALLSDDQEEYAAEVIMKPRKGPEYNGATLTTMTMNDAQHLFQELWDMGCRPKSEFGTGAHIEAMSHHLKDMRKIASKFLKIDL